MQLSKFNKGFRFLLCVIGLFSKYAWVLPLKDKKGIVNAFQKTLYKSDCKPNKKKGIVNAFQKTLYKSDCKPNKIWVDKDSKF